MVFSTSKAISVSMTVPTAFERPPFGDGESVDSQFEKMVAEVELEGRANETLAGYAKSLSLCDARAFKRNGIELVEVSKDEIMAPPSRDAHHSDSLYLRLPRGDRGALASPSAARRRSSLWNCTGRPLALPGSARRLR